jgi:fatty-acyl-CoA synthase
MLRAERRLKGPSDTEKLEASGLEQLLTFKNVYELFVAAATQRPNDIALTFLPSTDPAQSPRQATTAELLANITRAANAFTAMGATRQDSVAILLPSVPETQYAIWGAEASSVALPINFLLSVEHICDLIGAAGARVLVALGPDPATDIWRKAEAVAARMPHLKVLCVAGRDPPPRGVELFGDVLAQAASDRLLAGDRISPDATAAYFHTGGTTGAPKLARHLHRNQVFSAWACTQVFHYSPGDRIFNGFPMFHVAGAIIFGLAPLVSGVEVVLPTAAGLRNKDVVENHWSLVERFRPTILAGVPTSMAGLANVPDYPADIASAEFWITGGAPLAPDLAERFEKRFGMAVHEIFGMTETAGVIAITPRYANRRTGRVGYRLPFCELKIARVAADGLPGEDARMDESGCVLFRGPNCFPGYLDPSRDHGVLLENGWLMTGDLGRIDQDGFLTITGRVKDVIIRGGHNIDPSMIEEAAAKHPAVILSAAVGQPDGYAGEVPVLYVVLRPGTEVSAEDLSLFVAEQVSERPARPKRIFIIPEIPTTAVGKVFKPALRLDATRRLIDELAVGICAGGEKFDFDVVDDAERGKVVQVRAPGTDRAKVSAACAQLRTATAGLPLIIEEVR